MSVSVYVAKPPKTDDTHWAYHDSDGAKTTTVKRSKEGGYERVVHNHNTRTATAHIEDGSLIPSASPEYDPSSKMLPHNSTEQPHLPQGYERYR